MPYLDVKQLNKHYGPTKVFHNIDFSAAEGEFVTLLGPSGCGKSTLLRCLAGLTPVDRYCYSGRILCQCLRKSAALVWCSRTTRCFPT